MKRSQIKRYKIRRDWGDAQAKVSAEGKCRSCKRSVKELKLMGRRLEGAHLIGREYDEKSHNPRFDRYVHPNSVIPLCGPPTTSATCHAQFDGRALGLWFSLTTDEKHWVIKRVGEGQARRKIQGRAPVVRAV